MKIIYILGIFFLLGGAKSQEEAEDDASELLPIMKKLTFDAEEPGSGGGEGREECVIHITVFEKMYLRGVKEPNHKSYNETTLEGCEEKCCYETSFKCKSFSYFVPTKQCFVMNVTKDDDSKYFLISSGGHIHAERMTPTTTPATTKFPTPAYSTRSKTKSTTVSANGTPGSNMPGVVSPSDTSDKLVDPGLPPCSKKCNNGGTCRLRAVNDDVADREEYCECDKGYSGDRCELEISQAGGFPVWLIALIVLGGIILILFLTVCIMYHVYRKKTGEYRVVKQIQKWTRRGKKKRLAPGNTEDFIRAEEALHHHHTSPTTSVLSIHGSVTSSTTHSTTTSV